jgi:hypothetical protein
VSESEKMSLVCPKCKYPQLCPCDACNRGKNDPRLKWKNVSEYCINPVNEEKILIDVIVCGNCGFKMSGDQWLEEEIKQNK